MSAPKDVIPASSKERGGFRPHSPAPGVGYAPQMLLTRYKIPYRQNGIGMIDFYRSVFFPDQT